MLGFFLGVFLLACIVGLTVACYPPFGDRVAAWGDAVVGLLVDCLEALRRAGLRRLVKLLLGLIGVPFGVYLLIHWFWSWAAIEVVINWFIATFLISSSLRCLIAAVTDTPVPHWHLGCNVDNEFDAVFSWAERDGGRLD